MKFLFDNNLSPHLAQAINSLCQPKGIEVVHLRAKFLPETPDATWLGVLGNEGGWNIVTQDRLTKGSLEKEALRNSGIVAFIMAKGWASLPLWDKSWQLIRWWPRVVEQAAGIKGPAAFEFSPRFSGKGKFKQIQI